MKKMTTAQKNSWNKLTAKRTRKDRKRRPHVEALIKAQRKINLINKQIEAIRYFRAKHSKQEQTKGNIL